MRTPEKIFDELCQTYDFTTKEEFNEYLENADTEQLVNLYNEILNFCHCNAPRYCSANWDDEQIIDIEIRCWKECDGKRYELIIEDQYGNDVKTIDEVIDDMLAYEAEARELLLY